jgi:hypothetical protein
LLKEALATFGMFGAALSVLAQLAAVMPVASWLGRLLELWQGLTREFWRAPLSLIGAPLHHDFIAAMTIAVFMIMIAVEARVSARLRRAAQAPIQLGGWLDDLSWPSLGVLAALCMIFLVGHGVSSSEPLIVFGSKEWGKLVFALIVAAGYIGGDFIARREFHLRLVRLAAVVVILVVANSAVLYLQQIA